MVENVLPNPKFRTQRGLTYRFQQIAGQRRIISEAGLIPKVKDCEPSSCFDVPRAHKKPLSQVSHCHRLRINKINQIFSV